jgi:hypothetical protein
MVTNQMVTDLPIYDEYPSQSGDEIEKCIFPNTSNCETTCQYPMPLEDTSSNSLDSHDHMSSKLMREVEMKENQPFISLMPNIHDDSFVQCYENNLFSYEDHFPRCLESISWPKISDFANGKCVSKFFFELSSR